MRYLSTLLVAAAATINTVSCATVCYPASCGTYTSKYPATTQDQKTEWVTQNIALDKFDTQGGTRTLTRVTLKTIFKFETSSWVTCTNTADYCTNTYKGTARPGVEFKMDLVSSPGTLSQYWGRWGDYPYGGTYTNPGNPPVPDTSMDYSDEQNPVPLFVPYTYPLFDIIGFTSEQEQDPGNCIVSCTVWGYYKPTASSASTYYYGNNAKGIIVTYDSNLNGGAGGYSQGEYAGATGTVYAFGQEPGGVATPKDSEVFLGSTSIDIATTPAPIVKVIDENDPNGGSDQLMSPQTVLNLFKASGPGDQIVFAADAKGFIEVNDIGGNSAKRQETYAFVQMAVEYEYAASATQDPQFVGFQGQTFQVHGYPGSYFHLISAPSFQMNGRFTYLANGHCNYKHTPCWTHPGTYIDDVTLIVDELLVRITAGPVGTGYSVRINDEPFHAHAHGVNETSDHTDIREFVPTKFYDAATRLTVHLRSPLQISIRTDLFALTFHNADHFFNVDSQLLVRPILAAGRQVSSRYPHPTTGAPWFPEYPIHGFIGQTWANATYAHHKRYQGDVDDYVETRPYATESIYSQYSKKFDDKDMHWE